jgi:hypothetical protein
MPSDEQLRAYVDLVPPIYREILGAFPHIEPAPGLRPGIPNPCADFENCALTIGLGEVIQACQELERNGLVEIQNRIFVHRTALGERLIALMTGQQAPVVKVDPFPALPE